MNKIALIGAGSSVGRHLLAGGDPRFVGIYRSDRALSQLCDLDLGDRLMRAADSAALIAALRGCDTVVTLINDLNPLQALSSLRQTVDACAEVGVGQLIHLSSATIYGQQGGRVRTADSAGARLPWNSYAAGKQWQEDFLRRAGRRIPSIAVLRPGLIWGPGMAWLHAPAGELRRREAWVVEGNETGNFVNIHFLAHAISYVAQHPRPGLAFCNLFDRNSLSWSDYYRQVAYRLAIPCQDIRVLPHNLIPLWLSKPAALRYVFPLSLGWSVAPHAMKEAIKARVRALPKKRPASATSLESFDARHLTITRELWDLKASRGLPPSSGLLDELHRTYPRSVEQDWSEVESLRDWMSA